MGATCLTSCFVTFVDTKGILTDFFEWTDSFNGTAGGVATLANLGNVDPDSGAGGITLISVNGIPVSSVVEPPAIVVFMSGAFLLAASRRLIRREKV